MSVDIPSIAIAFGNVTPPQGDVTETRVHLGATREVSSFEVLLQNWDKKYSPGEANAIAVGSSGQISVGRGAHCPQLISTRTESVRFESSPDEHYVRVSGRCWGEKLFRRVVSKAYVSEKAESIVKDLLDGYAGLSHTRGEIELVEGTDTTYSRLEYADTPVFDVLKYVAATADDAGVIGYDFRVAYDGKLEFFPRLSKTSAIDLTDQIESAEYTEDITGVRNRVHCYGVADKSLPLDKDGWTESLTPSDGAWEASGGSLSLDGVVKIRGSNSVKISGSSLPYVGVEFTLNSGKEVDATRYPVLEVWLRREAVWNGSISCVLTDTVGRMVSHWFTGNLNDWFSMQLKVGASAADQWSGDAAFDWARVKRVRFDFWPESGSPSGNAWVDSLFFGRRRYYSMQEDASSQNSYGLRELVEVDEELYSDNECMLRARALLDSQKAPLECLSVKSRVIDYGSSPLWPADKVHVSLPNENVDADFRILSVEYNVDARTQTLEVALELGRERSMLADYLYALRSRTDHLSRHKVARWL